MSTLELRLCLLFGLLIAGSIQTRKHSHKRKHKPIIGGEIVPSITEFPFMAFLEITLGNKVQYCGGSILSPKYLLSAAYCFKRLTVDNDGKVIYTNYDRIKVYLGSTELSKAKTTTKVKQLFVHPKYQQIDSNGCYLHHNIAIVELEETLVFNENINKVNLALLGIFRSSYHLDCKALGWGIQHSDELFSKNLMRVNVHPIGFKDCFDRCKIKNTSLSYPRDMRVCRADHICTLHPDQDEKSQEFGDGGGPLICNDLLVGVVSLAAQIVCSLVPKNSPELYTRVDVHFEWIRKIMSGVREHEYYY